MKSRFVAMILAVMGIFMISISTVINEKVNLDNHKRNKKNAIDLVNVINMSSSNRKNEAEVVNSDLQENKSDVVELSMEQTPQSVYIPPRVEVYEGMTLEELGEKLNHSLGSSILGGKGLLIASKCIELGVDPYIATAIMLHETGCPHSCSNLVRTCNNVGGQKGAPNCGNGSYKYYATIDDGIVGHIENLHKNYFSKGRTTVESIGPKYAESGNWISKINWFVNKVRAS